LKRKQAGADGTLEQLITERSNETISWYHADMDALGAARPDQEPRATEYIAQMIAMIEALIEKGHAYEAEGHALFAVESHKEYGALSGRSIDDMIAGARVEVAPYKRNPMDFVLWKPSTNDLPGWDSPWGRGRPGWHIECSAMAFELLGASFDIHGGGNDLQFPHHENEIAQSACMGHGFANVWMHNEMLQVEGKKMSKSLGNFFTVRDLLDQGVPGDVIRFVMLSTHYRKPMEAEKTLRKWYAQAMSADAGNVPAAILDVLSDDLNTAGVLTELHKISNAGDAAGLNASLKFLGFLDESSVLFDSPDEFDFSNLAAHFQEVRLAAMASKDFSSVDALKSTLATAGVEVKMTKEGVDLKSGAGFEPSKLEGLI
jgi:cysteinyl-tRNA synthetase